MDEFLTTLADILEEDSVAPTDRLDGFASWDSLAVLSVIAMADSDFGARLSAKQVNGAATVQALYDLVTGAGTAA
jgi:acyl carrier protein